MAPMFIRNIIGQVWLTGSYGAYGDVGAVDCFSYTFQEQYYTTTSPSSVHLGRVTVNFSANRNKNADSGDDYFNPMAGHAADSQIQPYNTGVLILIVY